MNILFFGLGRIGLPQSLVFADSGHKVYGYDSDLSHVERISLHSLPFFEPGMADLLSKHIGVNYFPISAYKPILKDIDAIVFTLGTSAPDSESCKLGGDGDISGILETVSNIFQQNYKSGVLLVFRTTLYLGSTDRIRDYITNNFSLIEGVDFNIVFVPERLIEGSAILEEKSLPKIIGAYNETARKFAVSIFGSVGGKIIHVKNPKAAEFCKLTDNSYRNTIFAFSNEIAIYASAVGVDAHEVISAVNQDYERNNIPKPGFVSGYCLGKDPYIFEFEFNNIKNKYGRDFQSIWYYGRKTNDFLIDYCIKEVESSVEMCGKRMSQANIVILGLSFKENVDDFRMSHSIALFHKLNALSPNSISLYDPNLNSNKYTAFNYEGGSTDIKLYSELTSDVFDNADGVIVAHRHEQLRIDNVDSLEELLAKSHKPLVVFDGWNIWSCAADIPGVSYQSIGFRKDL